MKDPELRPLEGAAQLTLTWDSPRPYFSEESQKMMVYDLNVYTKTAFDDAINQMEG
jgi:hypothetical protein